MNDYVDLHTHTIASGHAYSTIEECAVYAAEQQLECIAVTDHLSNDKGGRAERNPSLWYYRACSENAGNLQRVIF